MANIAGPMSACSRAVGCNEHERLDPDSRMSRSDPFVNGRCECEDGWIDDYNSNTLGPFCREATVGEWPSLVLHTGGSNRPGNENTWELHSDYVERAFRRVFERERIDGDSTLRVLNPCAPCPVATTDDRKTVFCGDKFDIERAGHDQLPVIRRAYFGIRNDRDYLRSNGGRYPNACLVLDEKDILGDRVLVQFMTQTWSKKCFAMEIGVLVRKSLLHSLLTSRSFDVSANYSEFASKLQSPDHISSLSSIQRDYGIVWTFSHENIAEHREQVCNSLKLFLLQPTSVAAIPTSRTKAMSCECRFHSTVMLS